MGRRQFPATISFMRFAAHRLADVLSCRRRRPRRTAMDIPRDLSLLTRWAAHGTVHLVGAVALDLVVEPDIGMEIPSPAPDVGKGGRSRPGTPAAPPA